LCGKVLFCKIALLVSAGCDSMEKLMEFKKVQSLNDGVHFGEIVKISYRDDPFDYTDIYISVDGTDITLKYGAPSNLTSQTKLGKLVLRFVNLEVGQKIDLEKLLVGKKISFQTISETNKDGTFARIVDGSIKPVDGGPGK
jgi:hypothetical protein